MISKIRSESAISGFIEETCCENEICVTLDDIDEFVIIKVDKYYNSLNIEKRPPSIDCLIIYKCKDSINKYSATLVELKNTNKFDLENLKGKFNTTINDFILTKFKNLLKLDFQKIDLFYVSTNEIYKRDISLKLEALMNVRFKYFDKKLMIKPFMPNPAIKNCY